MEKWTVIKEYGRLGYTLRIESRKVETTWQYRYIITDAENASEGEVESLPMLDIAEVIAEAHTMVSSLYYNT